MPQYSGVVTQRGKLQPAILLFIGDVETIPLLELSMSLYSGLKTAIKLTMGLIKFSSESN